MLVGMVGLAMDYSRALSAHNHAQQVLDSATLVAIKEADPSKQRDVFDAYLKSQALDPQYAAFTGGKNGNQLTATSHYLDHMRGTFSRLFGQESWPIIADSEAAAEASVSEFEIDLKDAYGWFSKDVEFYVLRPDGSTEIIATISYVMTDHTGAGWRGTGTTTVSPSRVIKPGVFQKLWARMVAKDLVKHNTFIFSSDDPKTSNHLYIDGVQMTEGKTVDIGKLLPCGQKVEYSWEDSVDTAAWVTQDIFFEVKTNCEQPNSTTARLTR